MNVYNFDEMILSKDENIMDFYFFCIRMYPELIVYLFKIIFAKFLYFVKKINKETMKKHMLSFLSGIEDIEFLMEVFLNEKANKIVFKN